MLENRYEARRRAGHWSRSLAIAGVAVACLWLLPEARAAVGCALNDPEQDLRRFFPDLTDFTTQSVTFQTQNPGALVRLGGSLGDKLDPIYETADVPYNLYTVSRNGARLGYVFGANQRGRYSNIQVIVVTDGALELKEVYLQKIRSPAWESFRSEEFLSALTRIPLKTYPSFQRCYVDGRCDGLPIKDPTAGKESEDFRYILRALSKLHLLTKFLHHPVEPRPPGDVRARAERVVSWWNGDEIPSALDDAKFVPMNQAGFLRPDDPVILLDHRDGTRIYPLQVLNHHPVINERDGRAFRSLIWSPTSYSAVMLADYGASSVHGFEPSGDLLFGTGLVIDRATGSQWAPGIGQVVRGPRLGAESVPVGGAVLMSWGIARSHRPDAQVLRGQASSVEMRKRWDAYTQRYFRQGEAERVTVVASDHGIAAWTAGALEKTPLVYSTLGERPIIVVGTGPVVTAFESTVGERSVELVRVGSLFWSGAPLLWDAESQTLWEGYTGKVLVRGALTDDLRPLAAYPLPHTTFRLLLPRSRIHI